ncbi:MAG: hypothetical protein ACRD4I_12485, partial [Candidatus Angelobacter sp.]
VEEHERRFSKTAVATMVGAGAVATGAALYLSLRPSHNGHTRNGGSRSGRENNRPRSKPARNTLAEMSRR